MKQALLVIDVQQRLFDSTPPPHEAGAVVERINQLSAKARRAGAPVVFIQHDRPGTPLEFGSEGWQLDRRLVVLEGDTRIRKRTPDSFLGTTLADMLSSRGIERLVICGYASEFCVDTTTRRAAALGYPVVLASDAHTTHDKAHASGQQIREHHNITLVNVTSFDRTISAVPTAELSFDA